MLSSNVILYSGRHIHISLKHHALCLDIIDFQVRGLAVLVQLCESISYRSDIPAQLPDVIRITKVFGNVMPLSWLVQ